MVSTYTIGINICERTHTNAKMRGQKAAKGERKKMKSVERKVVERGFQTCIAYSDAAPQCLFASLVLERPPKKIARGKAGTRRSCVLQTDGFRAERLGGERRSDVVAYHTSTGTAQYFVVANLKKGSES